MFTPSRLSLARRRRGFTKVQLAKEAGITVRSITDYESEKTDPLPETVRRLADALGFPVSFFEAPDIPEIDPNATTFRALSKLTATKRDQAISAATLALDFHRWITEHFRLPALTMPRDLFGEHPEHAAEIVRMEWNLGQKPIPNMVHLLEMHGIRVFSLAEDYVEVDAFSTWVEGTPFVFLNTFKTAERSRMDAAHELGHLVLHRHGATTRSRVIEEEAKRFASAFLMPSAGVSPTAPHFPSLEQLVVLKRKWRVSVAALAFRLHELGVITDWHYRSLCIDISRRGYRTSEPKSVARETSQIMQKVIAALRDEKISVVDIARDLHLPVQELNAFVSGFMTLPVSSNAQESVKPTTAERTERPALKIVKGGS